MEHMYECINCIQLKRYLQVEKKKVSQKNRLITLLRELVRSYEAKDLNLTFSDLSRIHESSASEVNILKQRLSLYLNENQELLQLKNETASRNDFLEKKYRDIEDELSHLRFVNKQLSDYYREKEAEHDQHKDRLKRLAKKLLGHEPKNLEARKILNLQNTPIELDQKQVKTGSKKKTDEELKDMKKECLEDNSSVITSSKIGDSLNSEDLNSSINSEDDQDFEIEIRNFLNQEECSDCPTSTSMEELCIDNKVNDISEKKKNVLLVCPDSPESEVGFEQTFENLNENVIIAAEESDSSYNLTECVNASPSFQKKTANIRPNIEVIPEKNRQITDDCFEKSSLHTAIEEINDKFKDLSDKNIVDNTLKDSSDCLEFENSLPDLISPLKSDEHCIMIGDKEIISNHDRFSYESSKDTQNNNEISTNMSSKNEKEPAEIKKECCSNSSEQADKSKKSSPAASSKYKHFNEGLFFNRKPVSENCLPLTENYSNSYPQYMSCCNNVIDTKPPIVLKLYNCTNVEISIPPSLQRQELPIITVKDKLNGGKEPIQNTNLINKQFTNSFSFTKVNCESHKSSSNSSVSKHNESNPNGQENVNKSSNSFFEDNYSGPVNSEYYFLDCLTKHKDICNRIKVNEKSYEKDEIVKCERLFPYKLSKNFDVEHFCFKFKSLSINSSSLENSMTKVVSCKVGSFNKDNFSMLSISQRPLFHNTLKSTINAKSRHNEWIFGQNSSIDNHTYNIIQPRLYNKFSLKPSNLFNIDTEGSDHESQKSIIKNSKTEMKRENSSSMKKNVKVFDSIGRSFSDNPFMFSSKEVCENKATKRTLQLDDQFEENVIPSKVTVSKNKGIVRPEFQMKSFEKNKLVDKNINLKSTRNIPAFSDTLIVQSSLPRHDPELSKSCNTILNSKDVANSTFKFDREKIISSISVQTSVQYDKQQQNAVLYPFSSQQESSISESLASKGGLASTQKRDIVKSAFKPDREKIISSTVSIQTSVQHDNQQQNTVLYPFASQQESSISEPLASEDGLALTQEKDVVNSAFKSDREKIISSTVSFQTRVQHDKQQQNAVSSPFSSQQECSTSESLASEGVLALTQEKGLLMAELNHGEKNSSSVHVSVSGHHCNQKQIEIASGSSQKKAALFESQKHFSSKMVETPVLVKGHHCFQKEKSSKSTPLVVEDNSLAKFPKCITTSESKVTHDSQKAPIIQSIFDCDNEDGVLSTPLKLLDKNSQQLSMLSKIDKCSVLDATPPSIPGKAVDKRSISEEFPKDKSIEHVVQQKDKVYGNFSKSSKLGSLKNSSETNEALCKKLDTKNLSDKISKNKVISKANVNKDLKQNLNSKGVEVNGVTNKNPSDHLAKSSSNTPIQEITSKKKKAALDRQVTDSNFNLKSNNVYISPEVVPEKLELYLDCELQEIFKEMQNFALLSPLRCSPEIFVEGETNISCEESTDFSPKINGCSIKSKCVISSEILKEKGIDVVNQLLEKKPDLNKDELSKGNIIIHSKQDKKFLDKKTESDDYKKCHIFSHEDFKDSVEEVPRFGNEENKKKENEETNTLLKSNNIKTYIRNTKKVSPPIQLMEEESSFVSVNDEKSQNLVNTSNIINNYDIAIHSEPCSIVENSSEECNDSLEDNKGVKNSPIQGNKSQDDSGCNTSVISLGFYVNREFLDSTSNSNTEVPSEDMIVDNICKENETKPSVTADATEDVLSVNLTVDYTADTVHNEDPQEEYSSSKRKFINDLETEDKCPKKQKTSVEDDYISCERDVFICALKYLSEKAMAASIKDNFPSSRKPSIESSLSTKIAINHIKNLICDSLKSPVDNLYDNVNNTVRKIEQVNEASAVNLAKAIIEIISETDDKEDIKTKPFIPHMTKTVKVCLLIAVSFIGYNRDFVMQFLDVFELFISSFYDKSLTIKEGTQLVVLYTAFCRSYNLDYKVKCLIYDVLYTRNIKAYPMVYRIIQTWPDIIPSSQSCTKKECLLTETIIFILLTGAAAVDEIMHSYCIGNLRNFLQKYFGYNSNDLRRDDLVDKIITRIADRGGGLALVLLCKCEPWEWACTVVEKKLFPLLQNLKSSQMEEYSLCNYILTLGRIVRGFPITKAAHIVKNTLEIFDGILHETNSNYLSEIIIESISLLRRHNLMLCTSILMNWKPITKQVTVRTMTHIKSILRVKNVNHWKYVYSLNSVDIHHNTRFFRSRKK